MRFGCAGGLPAWALLISTVSAMAQAVDPPRPEDDGPAATATAATVTGPESPPETTTPPGSPSEFEGYDFGVVVQTMNESVTPLQRELEQSFAVFLDRMSTAESLLDEGDADAAMSEVSAAIDGVLLVRDEVLTPMWDGQATLQEQTGKARLRLARAVASAAPGASAAPLPDAAEATLDRIAQRIQREDDPLRKKRLVAHYRTARNLARIRSMAQQLTPDQRRLWLNVVKVLEQSSLMHQQVLMGTEVLFAQFEATSTHLKEYMELMDTVEGASELMAMLRGAEADGSGMTGFIRDMQTLQDRMTGFNSAIEQALQTRMLDLDDQLDAVDLLAAEGGGGVVPAEVDGELAARLDRLQSADR